MTPPVVARLRAEIADRLADLVPPDNRFALLDFPSYSNVGDNAIYAGTLAFLAERGRRPAFACIPAMTDWEALSAAIGSGPIFFNGGGNFGDLYDSTQAYREEVLRRHPGRPVIQLPQTIHFRSPARVDQAARAIERHGAFVLCVRDEASLAFARRHFACEVRLCPDMAFALGPQRRAPATTRLLLLLRDDEEAAGPHRADVPLASDIRLADWPDDPPGFHARVRRRALPAAMLAAAHHGRWAGRGEILHRVARARLRAGLRLLSSGERVVTDRLHGHILCLLLGIPHAVLDNSYGKITGFADTWQTLSAQAVLAPTLAQALAPEPSTRDDRLSAAAASPGASRPA